MGSLPIAECVRAHRMSAKALGPAIALPGSPEPIAAKYTGTAELD
jgi:hypothetical protein